MADDDERDDTQDAGEHEAGEREGGLEERLDRLEEMVRRMMSGGSPKGRASQADQAEQHRADMEKALADLRRQERADRIMSGLNRDMRKVKQAVFEKPPREFRKVETIMGWPDRD